MLKTTEEKFKIDENTRIKFVETCGRKYVDFYKNPNPFNIRLFVTDLPQDWIARSQILDTPCSVSCARRGEEHLLRGRECQEWLPALPGACQEEQEEGAVQARH